MPMLLNSEQNIVNDLFNCDDKPTFQQRFEWLISFFKLFRFFNGVNNFISTYSDKIDLQVVASSYEAKFTLGHPALSFPYMVAENQKYLGFFTTEHYEPKPLPSEIATFIDACTNEGVPVVYMSFGTFLTDPTSLPYIRKLFQSLIKTDLCFMYKANDKFIKAFSLPENRFYVRKWMPQKDLLASQKLAFFFSHCGNNGRIEGIYYTVPILCLPLFADQYFNALLIRNNTFGMMITKEDIESEVQDDAVIEIVTEMLQQRNRFKKSMVKAKDIVLRDPGSGTAVFLYHVNNILKYGNERHLKNEVLLKQSMVEIYNLDIFGIVLLFVLIVCHVSIYCAYKLCSKYFCRRYADIKRKLD